MQGGATAAEVVAMDGSEFSTVVRLGEVETLKESGSKGIGVRVFFGQRAASTYSSDLTPAGIKQLVDSALALAKITSEDPFAGIPEPAQLGKLDGDLEVCITTTCTRSRRPIASTTRAAPRKPHSMLTRASPTPKAEPSTRPSATRCWRTRTASSAIISARIARFRQCPIAQVEGSAMQRDYWYSVANSLKRLESPEEVGQIAAKRTLRRLGARKVKTAKVPIVFEHTIAGALVGHIFEAVNGDSIYRGASYPAAAS